MPVMASDPIDNAPTPVASREVPRSPLAGTRSQAMQRLQVGLFGLGSMVLLVGLANIIMTNARQNEAQIVAEGSPNQAQPEIRPAVRDPLADAGVVPDLPSRQVEGAAEPVGGDARPQPQP
jgi:hypothetical protein